MECFETCSQTEAYLFIKNGECAKDCGEQFAVDYDCVTECPKGMYKVLEDHTCVDGCGDKYPYKYGEECVADCSKTKKKMTKK